MNAFDYFNNNDLVIWGCGNYATKLLELLPDLSEHIIGCLDSNPDKQGKLFYNKWFIESPQTFFAKIKSFHLIITPKYFQNITNYLSQNNYYKDEDYIILDEQLELLILDKIYKKAQDYSAHVAFVLYSDTNHILKPSPIEESLRYYYMIIGDRNGWLRSNPPHIRQSHENLPYFSDAYIKNIFTGSNVIRQDRALYQEEYTSPYVNIVGGLRFTTDQHGHLNRHVHMIGPSHTYGFGAEDKYTTSSCLQRLLNKRYPHVFNVVNHGIRGMKEIDYLDKIDVAGIQAEDIVIISLRPNMRYEEFFSSQGIPFANLNTLIQRPHPYGEIFFDNEHLNYHGNLIAAEKIANLFHCFDYRSHCDSTTETAYRPELKQASFPQKVTRSVASVAAIANHTDSDEGLNQYLQQLQQKKVHGLPTSSLIGSIVMNCNPFTLGHYHLINIATQIVEHLYIFVVAENKSVFSFADRLALVEQGVAEFNNVTVLPSGHYIISDITFPEYFDKDNQQSAVIDPSYDIDIFGRYIAPALNISVRFAGAEPYDRITRQYNEHMRRILPQHAIQYIEIPRARKDTEVISASTVRQLLINGRLDDIRSLVPPTTFNYLKENEQTLRSKF